jgi:hypothetical protein
MNDRLQALPMTRRDLLRHAGAGFGMLGLAGTLDALGGTARAATVGPHFAPKAKRVIYLFMNGGPSHVDTFDPKPALKRYEGEKPNGKFGRNAKLGFMPSPFEFAAHGQGGVVMSNLFPHLATCADDLCVIRSMYTDTPNHEPGLLLMNSGHQQPVRPSMGSWVSYGLGTENQNLSAFVVLTPRRPVVGPQLWSNSFLPGAHQGMAVNTSDMRVERLIPNLNHPTLDYAGRKRQLDLLESLDRLHQERRPEEVALEAQIRALETAFPMQHEAAEVFDISKESEPTRGLRQLAVRPGVPVGLPAGGAGGAVHAGVLRRSQKQPAVGHAPGQRQTAPDAVCRRRPGHGRLAQRPEAARPVGGHARGVGR